MKQLVLVGEMMCPKVGHMGHMGHSGEQSGEQSGAQSGTLQREIEEMI